MKLKNARVGTVVGTNEFFPTVYATTKYRMVYGQIMEVLPDAVVIKWDDIAGEITHFERDLRSIFVDRKF